MRAKERERERELLELLLPHPTQAEAKRSDRFIRGRLHKIWWGKENIILGYDTQGFNIICCKKNTFAVSLLREVILCERLVQRRLLMVYIRELNRNVYQVFISFLYTCVLLP